MLDELEPSLPAHPHPQTYTSVGQEQAKQVAYYSVNMYLGNDRERDREEERTRWVHLLWRMGTGIPPGQEQRPATCLGFNF